MFEEIDFSSRNLFYFYLDFRLCFKITNSKSGRIFQVWFSTQLDLSAKRSLLRVGKRLQREAVSGWAGNSLKISDGLQVSEGEVSKTFAGMGVYLQTCGQ